MGKTRKGKQFAKLTSKRYHDLDGADPFGCQTVHSRVKLTHRDIRPLDQGLKHEIRPYINRHRNHNQYREFPIEIEDDSQSNQELCARGQKGCNLICCKSADHLHVVHHTAHNPAGRCALVIAYMKGL